MSALILSHVNRALNPRSVNTGAAGWTSLRGFGTGGAGSYIFVTSPTGPFGGNWMVRRKQWTTASTSSANAGYQVNADGSNYFAVTPGEELTVSAYIRLIGSGAAAKTFCLRVNFWNQVVISGAASVGATFVGSNVPSDVPGIWQRVFCTFTVPAGAAGMQVYPDCANVGDAGFAINDGLDCTNLLIESGLVLNNYFDGSITDTATTQFDWVDVPNVSTSQQIDTIDWSSGVLAKNQLNYWDSGAWQPFVQPGLTGSQGPQGPEGIRTSCGGCSFVGGQDAQPNSVMWDVTGFVADPTYAADTDPCLQLFDTSTLQTRRAGTFVITASTMLNGKATTSGSSFTMRVSQSGGAYVDFCRGPIPKGSDRGTATSIATLGVGDKLKFSIWIVVGAPPTKINVTIMAAVMA